MEDLGRPLPGSGRSIQANTNKEDKMLLKAEGGEGATQYCCVNQYVDIRINGNKERNILTVRRVKYVRKGPN